VNYLNEVASKLAQVVLQNALKAEEEGRLTIVRNARGEHVKYELTEKGWQAAEAKLRELNQQEIR